MKGGARPGSGRKNLGEEEKKITLINLSVDFLVSQMKSKKVSDAIKREIALKIAPKAIPQQLDVTSGGKPIVIPLEAITKYGKPTPSAENNTGGQPPL
jgi:hypothetical protein